MINFKALAPKSTTLRAKMHKASAGPVPARSIRTLHASEYVKPDFCARRISIMDTTGKKPRDEYLTTAHVLTFAFGHAIQRVVINKMVDAGTAVSDWKCLVCKAKWRFTKRPIACTVCGHNLIDPEEPRLVCPDTGLSGGLDVCADLGGLRPVIIETKSIRPEDFKKLDKPLPEHTLRTQLYLDLAARIPASDPLHGKIDTTRAIVFYVSKGGFGAMDEGLPKEGVLEKFSPYREYVVTPNPKAVMGPFSRAKQVKGYRDRTQAMPENETCPNAFCPRAKTCEVAKECFSGQFPAGFMLPAAP
ncbi:hypothetical protein [Roseococcus pinisoli]|uniref:PD-(D/E)XK endonuclease-like domain-containing protein n=1 Tax=Roseococcus pinisoli TaxID=2835040 RepID=A0ABS5QF47_9PROT|nr:hypothetical protein [Roseococcus pinisoli]MBS7812320.1 hypothetical protein [Roseococcus pinisoli]